MTATDLPTSRRSLLRRGVRAILATVAAAVVAGIAWLAVGDDADAAALARAIETYDIVVSSEDGVLTIAPTATSAGTSPVGVVFLPGTRIHQDAYVATWAPVVERTGVTVHIPSVPLNVPVLGGDRIDQVMAANPTTTTWIVGGHSMGGIQATSYVATAAVRPDGLLLWASGPGRTDLDDLELPALLIAAGDDTVLPLDRALREGTLPIDARIEVIDGMVHGQFGRYGDETQMADAGGRSDADTLAQLAQLTVDFIREVAHAA